MGRKIYYTEDGLYDRKAMFAAGALLVAACLASFKMFFVRIAPVFFVDLGLKLLLIGTFVYSICLYWRSKLSTRSAHKKFLPFFDVGLVFIAFCSMLGFFLNPCQTPFRTFLMFDISIVIQFIMIFFCIYLGGNLTLSKKIAFLILILFWAVAIAMFLTKDMRISNAFGIVSEMHTFENALDRNTNTVAFCIRSFTRCMPFLFLLGVFWEKKMGWWVRLLFLLSICEPIYFDLLMFKFRGAIIIVALTFMAGIFHFCKKTSLRQISILLVALVGVYYVLTSRVAEGFFERARTDTEKHGGGITKIIKGERFAELNCLFKSRTPITAITGSGFGSTYDAGDAFDFAAAGPNGGWGTVHMGIFIYFMYGGPLFMIFMYWMYIKAIFRRMTAYEKDDGFLVACKWYVVIQAFQMTFNPFISGFMNAGMYLPFFIAVGALFSDRINIRGMIGRQW